MPYQDYEVHDMLLKKGDDYLPDEIIDGGLRVENYSDEDITTNTPNLIEGTCEIECHHDNEDEDISFNCDFQIELDDDGEVTNIEFSNLDVN